MWRFHPKLSCFEYWWVVHVMSRSPCSHVLFNIVVVVCETEYWKFCCGFGYVLSSIFIIVAESFVKDYCEMGYSSINFAELWSVGLMQLFVSNLYVCYKFLLLFYCCRRYYFVLGFNENSMLLFYFEIYWNIISHKLKLFQPFTVPFQKNEFNLKRRQIPALQEANNRKQVISKKTQSSYAAPEHERAEQKRRTISNKVSECNSKKNHFSFNLKQKLCNIFRISKHQQYLRGKKSFLDGHPKQNGCGTKSKSIDDYYKKSSVSTRKLPPLPMSGML